MIIVKSITLFMIFGISTYIGIMFSKRYVNRVNELKEMKSILNMISTQIKFTYEPLPNIFKMIGKRFDSNVGKIFENAYCYMESISAGDAWNNALENSNTHFNKEDRDVLRNLGNMLGKVDVEGQIKEIELVDNFLDIQIEKAENEKRRNERLYKTLGVTIGMAVVIILI